MQGVSSLGSLSSLPSGSSASRTVRQSPASAGANPRAHDSYTPSGNTKGWAKLREAKEGSEVEAAQGGGDAKGIQGFDLEKFRQSIRDELLAQISAAKKKAEEDGSIDKWVSDIPYAVGADEVAAEVPEEWNAENTSQRIADFALSFRGSVEGMSDEEFIEQVRQAVQEGFKLAKRDIGSLPGPSAKLFNDTYEATMKKLDQALEDMKAGSFQTPKRPEVDVVAEQAPQSSYSTTA